MTLFGITISSFMPGLYSTETAAVLLPLDMVMLAVVTVPGSSCSFKQKKNEPFTGIPVDPEARPGKMPGGAESLAVPTSKKEEKARLAASAAGRNPIPLELAIDPNKRSSYCPAVKVPGLMVSFSPELSNSRLPELKVSGVLAPFVMLNNFTEAV